MSGFLVRAAVAKHVHYNNDTSGLSATNVQDALDEIVAEGTGSGTSVDIDAGTTADLTAVIAAATAAGECTVRLRKQDYTWPAGTAYPLGMNMVGQGFDANHSVSAGVGSKINTTDNSILVQALGSARGSVIRGVYFADGFQVRKQNTTFIGCRFDNNGLIVGDSLNTCAPYYLRAYGCRYEAAVGGSCIQYQNFANATYLDGNILVPQNGRGLDFEASAVGNKFVGSVDRAASSSTDMGSFVYFGAGSPTSNDVEFIYFEASVYTGKWRDGGHVVFGVSGAARNVVKINSDIGASLRVVLNSNDNDIILPNMRNSKRTNADFNWDYSFPDTVMLGSGNDVYIPPALMRRSHYKLLPTTAATSLHAAFSISAAAINNAGSGGTDGTYYQSISDGNTVTGQDAIVQIVVAGGVMTGTPVVKHGGWNTVALSTSFAVTAVTGLTGGTLTLTVLTNNLSTPAANMNDFVVVDQELTSVIWDPSNTDAYVFPGSPYSFGTVSVSPGANGNATIAHAHTRAPTWADAKILGDMGGVDIHIEIQALDATNITLRFSNAAGTDITTGGPYTVRWACK